MSIHESLPNIGRGPISHTIVDLSTNYLLSGVLKPGDKLPTEFELAEKLGVGRNSVREAVKMLSSIGVVEIRKGAGTFIASTMKSSILNPLILSLVFEQGTSKELIELRLLLEIGSAELALPRVTETDLQTLEKMNNDLKQEADREERDFRRLLELDLAFHTELWKLAGNKLLFKLVDAVYALFLASIEKTVGGDPHLAYTNHEMVIDAFKKGDIELIRRNIRESMKYWMDTVHSR
jgi:GntR family transcriptional repressor for pyruvate dehydrogenase complex